MIQLVELVLSPAEASQSGKHLEFASKVLGISKSRISFFRLVKRSVDARQKEIKINLKFSVVIDEPDYKQESIEYFAKNVKESPEVHIIGAGPAGLFAALRLIELGLKPIVFERGKDVHERKRDIANQYKENEINPDSNYCYGEGGAGTFSDGKLYTRASKRGNINRVLELFFLHGANENVLYEAHPHIGTDKLPSIIEKIRQRIIDSGGQVLFNTQIIEIITENNQISGVKLKDGQIVKIKLLILASGHSARDVYRMMNDKQIALEAKGFAMGVRIEHPQQVIDRIQYHGTPSSEYLPAASYNLVQQINGRGVYSFCMCPGGFIVPASTAKGEMVVNGMSASKRNSPFANSGFVTEIREEDLIDFKKYGALAGLEFQASFEELAYKNGGGGLISPAQCLNDFTVQKASKILPKTSYIPGIISSEMHRWMPSFISNSLSSGLKYFGQRMKGFLTNDAIMVGVESRTSSPVRIPRDRETLEHIQIKGLYPCGEGSGYAGGIVSSAMDGMNVAEKIAFFYKSS